MSADFEVFMMGLFCGMMGTLLMMGAFVWIDDKVTKRQLNKSGNSNGNSDERCRECGSMVVHTQPMETEEVISVLYTMRMILGLSQTEKDVLDKVIRLVKKIEEY